MLITFHSNCPSYVTFIRCVRASMLCACCIRACKEMYNDRRRASLTSLDETRVDEF